MPKKKYTPLRKRLIPEIKELLFSPCTDISKVADGNKSTLELMGKRIFKLGDIIKLKLIMYDGKAKAKTIGGDYVRARMFNDELGAYAPAAVIDHNNGTYTIEAQALWVGRTTFEVELIYPRELISAIIRLRINWDFKDLRAVYTKGSSEEETFCHHDQLALIGPQRGGKLCDFTYWNNSLPWFCEYPHNPQLSCQDYTETRRNWDNYTLGANECEKNLAFRKSYFIGSNIDVLVQANKGQRQSDIINTPTVPCTQYNTTKQWDHNEPAGFFYQMEWITRHCKGGRTNDIGNCLRNKVLYSWGDSTLRAWITFLMDHIRKECRWKSELRKLQCVHISYCETYNFTIIRASHNIPVNQLLLSVQGQLDYLSRPLPALVANYGSGTSIIFIMTFFVHVQMYNFRFYEANMLEIRKGVAQILNEHKNCICFIKMPHAFHVSTKYPWKRNRQPDYVGYIYTNIIHRVFSEPHDRIIFLNNVDATIAVRNIPLHPKYDVISAMVYQLLSYICHNTNETAYRTTDMLHRSDRKHGTK